MFVKEDGGIEIENPEGVKIKKEIPEDIFPKVREGVYDASYWVWAKILEEEIKKIKEDIHQLEKKWDYLYILYLKIYSSGLV